MNTLSRHFRNGFHPAWLLLPVPSLLWVLFTEQYNVPAIALGALFRLLPLLVLLVPLTGWFRRDATPFARRMAKEFRTQLPGALLAIAAPGALLLFTDGDVRGFFSVPYALGCTLLGATAFGSEFEQRTMGALLVQPQRRSALYGEKLLVLGALLGLALIETALGLFAEQHITSTREFRENLLVLLGWPIFAFCTGPLLSLRTRGTLAGAVFVVAVPMGLMMTGLLGIMLLRHWWHPNPEWSDFDYSPQFDPFCWVAGPLYLAVSTWLGWRTFARLEVREGGPGGGGNSHPLAGSFDRLLRVVWPHRGGGVTMMLVRKELRLHVVPWLITALLLGCSLLLWLVRWQSGTDTWSGAFRFQDAFLFLAVMFGGLNLLFLGAASVAEERQLGTLDWQLTSPPSVRRQWWIKAAVTLVLAMLLGIVLPFLVVAVTSEAGQLTDILPKHHWELVIQLTLALMGTGAAIYASSISRSTVKAAVAAIAVLAGGGLLAAGLVVLLRTWDAQRTEEINTAWQQHTLVPPPFAPGGEPVGEVLLLALALVPLFVLGFCVCLAGKNFRRGVPKGRELTLQLVGLALAALVPLFIFGSATLLLHELNLRQELYDHPFQPPKMQPAASAKPSRMLPSAVEKRNGRASPTNSPALPR